MCKHRFAIRLTACLLAGCLLCPAPRARAAAWDPFAPWDDPGAYYEAAPRSAAQQAYGSAGLVGWPSVLISIYLDEEDGAVWDEDEIARSRRQMAVAVDWIRAQCAAYHASPAIHWDDGTPDSGLFAHVTYRGRFAGGEDSDESDDFYTALDALCASLDTDELHQRYGTSSVGFAVFLPVAGNSFTVVHYGEDGSDYYHEYSCLYQYDVWSGQTVWDTPTVYAHELLHLFGAPDLYDGSEDPYVTPELTAYIQENWPDALMLDTYGPGEMQYDRVEKTLCPLTAYRLGLCRSWPGLAQFPDSGASPAGVFALDNTVSVLPDDSVAV